MPTFDINLISITKLVQSGYKVEFMKNKAIISINNLEIEATLKNSLFELNLPIKLHYSYFSQNIPKRTRTQSTSQRTLTQSEDTIRLWHERLGHRSLANIFKILNLPYKHIDLNCEICLKAKFTNMISREITPKATYYLERIAIDLCGPIKPTSLGGKRYIIFFIDSASRLIDSKLLSSKSQAFHAFIEYKTRAEKQNPKCQIRAIKSDLGTEFLNSSFKNYCNKTGIIQQFSGARTPKQNGLIERVNRTIIEMVRALLYRSKLPLYLWGEAVTAAVYIYNITPHSSLPNNKNPYETVYGIKPNYNHIRTWGSIAYYKDKRQITKLEPRAKKAILIGFSQHNNYKLLNPKNNKMFWARDVKILENHFINDNSSRTNSPIQAIDSNDSTIELGPIQINSENRQNSQQVDQSRQNSLELGQNRDRSVTLSQNSTQIVPDSQSDDIDELSQTIENSLNSQHRYNSEIRAINPNFFEINSDTDELALNSSDKIKDELLDQKDYKL